VCNARQRGIHHARGTVLTMFRAFLKSTMFLLIAEDITLDFTWTRISPSSPLSGPPCFETPVDSRLRLPPMSIFSLAITIQPQILCGARCTPRAATAGAGLTFRRLLFFFSLLRVFLLSLRLYVTFDFFPGRFFPLTLFTVPNWASPQLLMVLYRLLRITGVSP